MKKTIFVLLVILLLPALSGCTFLKVYLKEEVQPLQEQVLAGSGRDKILLVDISGMITSQEHKPSFSDGKQPGLLPRIREELDRARRDPQVKAVVIRINSPGGGVTASDLLYHEIESYRRDTGAVVVAHIMDVGASGAYYAALAADRITAQPTSVTGSIGVIMFRFDATGLMQKIGLQAQEIASGEHKGMGSPFRQLSPEDKKLFQGMVDSLYGRFTGLVSASRKMPPDRVRQLADGRIFTSQQAQAAGLIDGIGYLDDAVEQAKQLARLPQAVLVTYARPGDFRPTVYSLNLLPAELTAVAGPGVGFFYLWWP